MSFPESALYRVLSILEENKISYEVKTNEKKKVHFDKIQNRYFVIKKKAYEEKNCLIYYIK